MLAKSLVRPEQDRFLHYADISLLVFESLGDLDLERGPASQDRVRRFQRLRDERSEPRLLG